jgi:hypothetical protein
MREIWSRKAVKKNSLRGLESHVFWPWGFRIIVNKKLLVFAVNLWISLDARRIHIPGVSSTMQADGVLDVE